MRKISSFIRLAAFGAVVIAPLAFSIGMVQAQIAETDQPYTPSGHIFDANQDSSKVVGGSQTDVETRADVYEADNFRRQLEAQARREHLHRFSAHDFNRHVGPYNDY